MQERTFYILILLVLRRHPCDDRNVPTTMEPLMIQPEAFSYQSGDSVPYYTVADFLAYRNSKPVFFPAAFYSIHDEILIGIGFSIFVYVFKFIIFFNRLYQSSISLNTYL